MTQYTLSNLLKEEHILLNLQVEDAAGAIEALVSAMRMTGHVDLAYAKDVIEREKTFPTGLPTEPLPVAIPHADPKNVVKSALGLAVLLQPVEFGLMGTDGSQSVYAKIVILLAIKEAEKQVEMLRQLIGVIQSGELLSSLVEVEDTRQALRLLKNSSSQL